MTRSHALALLPMSVALCGGMLVAAASAMAEGACTPGKTHKIAFMLKQQTAFRYLHADVPFFKKTAEADGYTVIVQSAENDAQNQVSQAENVITQGVDAIAHSTCRLSCRCGDRAVGRLRRVFRSPPMEYDPILGRQAGRWIHWPRSEDDGGAAAAKAVVAKAPKGELCPQYWRRRRARRGRRKCSRCYHSVLDPPGQGR